MCKAPMTHAPKNSVIAIIHMWRWFALLAPVDKDTYGVEMAKQVSVRLYFVDFLREPTYDEETGEAVGAIPSFYESTESLASLAQVTMARQVAFNQHSRSLKLDLVLFEDALKHMMVRNPALLRNTRSPEFRTLNPTKHLPPYTLHPTPYTLHPAPCTHSSIHHPHPNVNPEPTLSHPVRA